jgi:uncharacterized protein with HEPN domain
MLRDCQYLQDILDSARLAIQYVCPTDRQHFLDDLEKQDSVIRRLEIMGEAAKRLSDQTLAQLPQIDWKRMKGMRDVLVHDYDDVEAERVWDTVQIYLPKLVSAIEAFLAKT